MGGVAGVGLFCSGCMGVVSTAAGSEPLTDGATSAMTTSARPVVTNLTTGATVTEPPNPVEQSYQSQLAAYRAQLPVTDMGALSPAAADVQNDWVNRMKRLYKDQATSREIFTLYLSGIRQLSPDAADLFTACAISGMRRNSFEDYTEIEQNYLSDSGFLKRFLAEAEKYDFDYLALCHHPDMLQDTKVRSLVSEAQDQGYYVASSEGMLYYLVDFTHFAAYRAVNTKPMADLIESLAIDCLEPMSVDGGFVVDLKTVAARTYGLAASLRDYHGSSYEKFLVSRFRDHMTLLLFGIDNTPNYDYSTGIMHSEALSVLKDVASLKNSTMGQITAEFLEILAANNNKVDESVQQKTWDLLNKINTIYGITADESDDYGQWMSGNFEALQ
jgi:hypothetical protein